MNKAHGINIMVQFVIISCSLLGLVYSVPLHMIGTSAPSKAKTGIGEISQVLKAKNTQYTEYSFDRNNRFSNDDSSDSDEHAEYIYEATLGIYEKIRSHQPSEVNKLTQENVQFSDTRILFTDDHGSNDSGKDPGSLPVETNQKTGSELDSDSTTLGWSETSTGYTTETSEYETTTDEVLVNRIGVSTAVVASLLG